MSLMMSADGQKQRRNTGRFVINSPSQSLLQPFGPNRNARIVPRNGSRKAGTWRRGPQVGQEWPPDVQARDGLLLERPLIFEESNALPNIQEHFDHWS